MVAPGASPGYRSTGFERNGMELAPGIGFPPHFGDEWRLSLFLQGCQIPGEKFGNQTRGNINVELDFFL
jgi:hypothetical protein